MATNLSRRVITLAQVVATPRRPQELEEHLHDRGNQGLPGVMRPIAAHMSQHAHCRKAQKIDI